MQNLTVEGKIAILKTLAISKIIHFSNRNYQQTKQNTKKFIWNKNNPEIKHSTLCNKYENGGLKNVDILSKVISLQYSILSYLRKIVKFHSNLSIPANKIKRL